MLRIQPYMQGLVHVSTDTQAVTHSAYNEGSFFAPTNKLTEREKKKRYNRVK